MHHRCPCRKTLFITGRPLHITTLRRLVRKVWKHKLIWWMRGLLGFWCVLFENTCRKLVLFMSILTVGKSTYCQYFKSKLADPRVDLVHLKANKWMSCWALSIVFSQLKYVCWFFFQISCLDTYLPFVAPLCTNWAQEVQTKWLGRISKSQVIHVKYAGNSTLIEFQELGNSGQMQLRIITTTLQVALCVCFRLHLKRAWWLNPFI